MVKQGKNNKIALIGYSLANGGQERVFSNVSELLYDLNFDVHVVVLENNIAYPYYGTLINLGKYSKFEKYFQLRKYLKINDFDYIIDFRYRINPIMELLYIYYIYAKLRVIYTIHSSKLRVYFTNKKWIAKLILKKAYKIVSVSNKMDSKIKKEYRYEKGIVIPNSISPKQVDLLCTNTKLHYNYCIAVGRLVALKQFDKLIEIYSKSDLINREIHLVIIGDGEEKEYLEKQIAQLQMTEYIHLLGYKSNAICYIKNAQFLILSSKYEGFSMVILEALHTGVPVVSFDCETGPSELVVNRNNGLLVKNQDFIALQLAIDTMVNDIELYRLCKQNAKKSVQLFSAENIKKKWLDLLDNYTF